MKKIKNLTCILTLLVLIALPVAVGAAPLGSADSLLNEGGFGTTVKLGTTKELPAMIAEIINVALGFLGIIAVVIILIGGFMWMTAAGNDEKTKKARALIVAGIIGLAIILSAFAIAKFVLKSLLTATGVT